MLVSSSLDTLTMRLARKQNQREFFLAMLTYAVVLMASVWLLKHFGAGLGVWSRSALALLPVLPIILLERAIVRSIRVSDELEQRINLEAAAIAGLLVGPGFFTLALLASAKVITLDGGEVAIWVFPALCGTFGVVKCWTSLRYRE